MDRTSRPGTIRINPWGLAKRLGVRESGHGIPDPEGELSPAPGQAMLREIGNADQSKRGSSWFKREPRLNGAIHQTSRRADLAGAKTRQTRDRVSRRAQRIERFHARPEVAKHGVRRGMGHLGYAFALLGFTVVEGYLNSLALLVIGESQFRIVYAIGLGMGLMLLARFLGVGMKHRAMEAPDAPSTRLLTVLGATGAALIGALAFLRAEALRLAVLVAVGTSVAASTGSAAAPGTTTMPVPSTSWIWFGLLQGAIFVAAVECSRQHANWVADEGDRERRAYRWTQRILSWLMGQQTRAAIAADKGRGRYAASFAETLEDADEARHWNGTCQLRYAHYHAISRDPTLEAARIEVLPVEEKVWRGAPVAEDRVGPLAVPGTNSLWDDFVIPAPQVVQPSTNGHRSPASSIRLSDRRDY